MLTSFAALNIMAALDNEMELTMNDSPELLALLKQWSEAKAEVAAICAPIIAKEMKLRKQLFAMAFPAPTEGTNNVDLPHGWKVKATYKLDRKIDEASLPAVLETLRKLDVVADALVRYKPEIDTKAYKALSEPNRAVFDSCLTIKPASPTIELIPPKGAVA